MRRLEGGHQSRSLSVQILRRRKFRRRLQPNIKTYFPLKLGRNSSERVAVWLVQVQILFDRPISSVYALELRSLERVDCGEKRLFPVVTTKGIERAPRPKRKEQGVLKQKFLPPIVPFFFCAIGIDRSEIILFHSAFGSLDARLQVPIEKDEQWKSKNGKERNNGEESFSSWESITCDLLQAQRVVILPSCHWIEVQYIPSGQANLTQEWYFSPQDYSQHKQKVHGIVRANDLLHSGYSDLLK